MERSSNWLLFTSKIKSQIASCPFPWVLGNIITWAEANILNVFDTVLAEPLIPSYAHVYQHLRNENAVEENADLEGFCDKSQHLLFWEGRRPYDQKTVERSFVQWIDMVDPGNASGIVESRFEENLAYCIGSNNWCISRTITKRYMLAKVDYLDHAFVRALQIKLEEGRRCIDTFALSETIRGSLAKLDSVTATELHETHLWGLRIHPGVIDLFPLRCEYLSNCLMEVCMGCEEASGCPMFSCSGCKYAKFCGRSCQKASWPRHRQYCSSKVRN